MFLERTVTHATHKFENMAIFIGREVALVHSIVIPVRAF